MPQGWTRIADPALEERYRVSSRVDDQRLAVAVIAIWLIPILVNTWIDWVNLGRTPLFHSILVARTTMGVVSVLSLVLVLRARSPRSRDVVIVVWTLFGIALATYVSTQRPYLPTGIQGFLALALVMAWVLFPVPFRIQALLAGTMMATWIVASAALREPPPRPQRITMLGLLIVANILGATVSLVIHRMRRGHFLATIEAREAGAALLDAQRQLASARENDLQSQLIHAQRAGSLGSLAAAITHELGQPLTAIRANATAGISYLRRETPEIRSAGAALEDVAEEAERAGAIIRRMRGYLRRGEMVREPVSPSVVAADAIALVQPAARKRGVSTLLELASDLPDVPGDPVQLLQVAVIALTNAIEALDASAAHRDVSLWARATADGVEMGVDDAGPGIDPDVAPRVFEPFFTTKADGMGMGLPIARNIVEAHGGTISVERRPSGGARVSWRIPRGAAA